MYFKLSGIPAFDLQMIKSTSELFGSVASDFTRSSSSIVSVSQSDANFAPIKSYSLGFWINISSILEIRKDTFPTALFYASLDISSDEFKTKKMIFAPRVYVLRKKTNRYVHIHHISCFLFRINFFLYLLSIKVYIDDSFNDLSFLFCVCFGGTVLINPSSN